MIVNDQVGTGSGCSLPQYTSLMCDWKKCRNQKTNLIASLQVETCICVVLQKSRRFSRHLKEIINRVFHYILWIANINFHILYMHIKLYFYQPKFPQSLCSELIQCYRVFQNPNANPYIFHSHVYHFLTNFFRIWRKQVLEQICGKINREKPYRRTPLNTNSVILHPDCDFKGWKNRSQEVTLNYTESKINFIGWMNIGWLQRFGVHTAVLIRIPVF